MIDVDEALRDYATRWNADQPAAPDLDDALIRPLIRARTRRMSYRWSLALAAACVLVLAVAVVSYAVGRSAKAPSARPTSPAAPRPPSAAQRARLERLAFNAAVRGGDMFASADAVRTTVRGAATLLDGKPAVGVGTGPIWFVELHGRSLSDATEGRAGAVSRGPYVYFTVPIGVVEAAFSGTSSVGYDLARLGTVVHLLSGPKTAAQLAHVQAVALRAVARYGHARIIETVRTTGYQAELATGTTSPGQSSTQVWLVQATGHFVCPDCRGPRAVRGGYVTLIIGGGVSEFGITDQPIDLHRLGAVIRLKG